MGTNPPNEQVTSRHNGPPSRPLLPLLQEQALPQEQVQPWCTRCQDQDLRPRSQEGQRRRLPALRPPRLQRVRAAVLTSVRTRDSHRATALEALRRCQYKFPGRQKIIVSKMWGFTPLKRDDYVEKRKEGKIKIDGAYVQFLRNKGALEYNMRRFPEAFEQEA